MDYLELVNFCFLLLFICLINLLFLFQGIIFFGKIFKFGKFNGKSVKFKFSVLKFVIIEVDMLESKMEDNREFGSEYKIGVNEKIEKFVG